MGFMQSYKHLDKLCRDMNGVGVTGYLEDMERVPDGAVRVDGWRADYAALKRYRHIRNQIAHDEHAEENDLTSPADARWLDAFSARILNGTDPLAQNWRLTRARAAAKPPARSSARPSAARPSGPSALRPARQRRSRGCGVWLAGAFVAVFLLLALVLLVRGGLLG